MLKLRSASKDIPAFSAMANVIVRITPFATQKRMQAAMSYTG